jgi:hypothetical protein
MMEPDRIAPASAAYFKVPARGKIVEKGYIIVVNAPVQQRSCMALQQRFSSESINWAKTCNRRRDAAY